MKLPKFLRMSRPAPSGPARPARSGGGALGVFPSAPAFVWSGDESARAAGRYGQLMAQALESPQVEIESGLRAALAAPAPQHFEHLSDGAARLFALAVIQGTRTLPMDLQEQVAGEVARHCKWILQGWAKDGARRALQSAALVVAGLGWPELPGASRAWSRGLSDLGQSFPALVNADGGHACESAAILLRVVQACWMAVDVCERAKVASPAELIPALVRASTYLRDLGAGGPMPALGPDPYEPLIGSDTQWPLAQAERRGWQVEEPPGGSKDWVIRPLRETGVLLMHARIKGQTSRVVVELSTGQVIWHVQGQAVLAEQGTQCMLHPERWSTALKVARVDGRCAAVVFTVSGRSGEWTRDVRAEGGRLVVTDKVLGQVLRARFAVGPELELSRREKVGQWLISGPIRARVTLDVDQASWVSQPGPALEGTLSPGRHRSRFELG